jgi:hypothetical protein
VPGNLSTRLSAYRAGDMFKMNSSNRLVHDAVMSYDRRTSDGTFRYNVMTCFLPEAPTSREAIETFMTNVFNILIAEIDRRGTSWRCNLDRDDVETAIHNGLQFTARVDRFRRFIRICEFAGLPDSPARPGPRWPAGPLRPGGPRAEAEKVASKLH